MKCNTCKKDKPESEFSREKLVSDDIAGRFPGEFDSLLSKLNEEHYCDACHIEKAKDDCYCCGYSDPGYVHDGHKLCSPCMHNVGDVGVPIEELRKAHHGKYGDCVWNLEKKCFDKGE